MYNRYKERLNCSFVGKVSEREAYNLFLGFHSSFLTFFILIVVILVCHAFTSSRYKTHLYAFGTFGHKIAFWDYHLRRTELVIKYSKNSRIHIAIN